MNFKSFAVMSVLATVLCSSAMAYWGPYYRPYNPYWRYRRCSPEMTQNSTSLVQKTLSSVAADQNFASANTFQTFVASTSQLTDATAKLHAYLGAVGVDSNDAAAVAEFVGARDHSSYVTAAEKNLGLTQAQADILVGQVTTILLNLTTGVQK